MRFMMIKSVLIKSNLSIRLARAKQIAREQGLGRLVLTTVRYLVYQVVNCWRGDNWWQGKLVEILGNKARLDGVTIYLDEDCISTKMKSRFFKRTYECPERYLIRRYLPINLPVIDLGACIGVTSCIINRRLFSPARQLSVEANPHLIPLLKRNRDRNQCQFKVVNAALAYGADEVTFYLHEKFVGGSVQRETDDFLTVPATSLQALTESQGFDQFVLVCDIEGGEVELIRNELTLLKEHVIWFFVSTHDFIVGGDKIDWADTELQAHGFQLVEEVAGVRLYCNKGLLS